jgi:ABC-2 type transport system permease protein
MAVYRTFLDNQSKILGMVSLLPKGALQFKGVSNFNDLLSVLGFYAANNVVYMMVLGSIYAIVLSSNILLKEEYNKTAEYLLTWPLTRSEIFFSKVAVLSLNVFLLNLVTALAGFICIELVKFGAAGLFLSTLMKRAKPITTLCIGLILIFYFIYTISKITDSVAALGYLSPFKYADMNAINPAYKLEFFNLLYFVGLTFLLGGISYRLYNRKDIYI